QLNLLLPHPTLHYPAPSRPPKHRSSQQARGALAQQLYLSIFGHSAYSSLPFFHQFVKKSEKARKVAHAVLHVESMIGALPVHEGKILYMGCIDPHLIYGSEVAIDASKALMDQFVNVQLAFFRRLLGLSKTSIRVAIYTETGIIPLQFRWLNLPLRALAYFLSRPTNTFVRAALNESIDLDSAGKKSWFKGLKDVINTLCPHYELPDNTTLCSASDSTVLGDFNKAIQTAVTTWISDELNRVSKRSYLLQIRQEPQENGRLKYHISCSSAKPVSCQSSQSIQLMLWSALDEIQNPRHRKALTRLITGDHSLAVVRLTWSDNHRLQVPHEQRLCRFCTQEVEAPEHALLQCPHQALVDLRASFWRDFKSLHPQGLTYTTVMDQPTYVAYLASCRPTFAVLAKWVFEVLKIYDGTPLLIPREFLRDSRSR
ncbi:hypothetical protein BT96DRAFT_809289, partial [Gymnopus androsaceus JB14]